MSLSYLPNLLDPLINYCPLFSEGKSKQVNKSQPDLSGFLFLPPSLKRQLSLCFLPASPQFLPRAPSRIQKAVCECGR